MLDYKREYERWLASDALNADEKAELQAIAGDETEIESRFYGPLEFGTAGLRGTMKVGLHQMNVHVIRWATQGFADVIAAEGMTLYDALQALYKKYGWYGEKTHNLVMPGLDGLEKMAALMKRLRTAPPANIAGVDVVVRKDYQDGSTVDCATGNVGKMELSGSNVLRFELADGTTILVRPSGTEPKIKVYILTKGVDAAERDANIEKYSAWVKTLTE